jgi:hypothetical protein
MRPYAEEPEFGIPQPGLVKHLECVLTVLLQDPTPQQASGGGREEDHQTGEQRKGHAQSDIWDEENRLWQGEYDLFVLILVLILKYSLMIINHKYYKCNVESDCNISIILFICILHYWSQISNEIEHVDYYPFSRVVKAKAGSSHIQTW